MSMNACNHPTKAYKDDPFGEPYQPTDKEINEHRLYQCHSCKKWYSLIG